MTVSGTGFQAGLSGTFSGTGVSVTVVDVAPTTVTLSLDVAAGAPLGYRTLTITNVDAGRATRSNAIRVVS